MNNPSYAVRRYCQFDSWRGGLFWVLEIRALDFQKHLKRHPAEISTGMNWL